MNYPCVFLTPTNRQRLSLRRYAGSRNPDRACPLMPGEYSYHDVSVPFGEAEIVVNERGAVEFPYHLEPAHDDPRWPTHCKCGYWFRDTDEWQLFNERISTRSDNGAETTLREAGPGALWYAGWLEDGRHWTGPDGRVLMCKTPGGDWNIDSRASNCTMPGEETHRCWVRHGDPTDPQGLHTGVPLHVDKAGNTCQAGAGSIQCGNYHGFLHNGELTGG